VDNAKKAHKIRMAISILNDVLKTVEEPALPAFKRGDISLKPGDPEKWLFIHNGAGCGKWLSHPGNVWTSDSREFKQLVRFATRAEWASHFPGEPYPLAPTLLKTEYTGIGAVLRKSTTNDGWLLSTRCVETRHRCGLIMAKAIAAEKLDVPDDVELKWEIVE